MRRRLFPIALTALVLLTRPALALAAGDVRVPPGYSVLAKQRLGNGLTHVVLARSSPPERVHVALLQRGAPYELRAVLSNDAIKEDGERLERTSAMCRRVRCLIAVNGDFFSDEGIPVGAVVSDGELIRSPNPSHHQLMLDANGRPSDGTFAWRGRLVATDLTSVAIDAVNVERGKDQIVLYTPAFGPSTETNQFGAELILRIVQPDGPVRIGQTSLVEIAELRRDAGNAPIGDGELVLSGHGRGEQRLTELWNHVQAGEAAAQALLRVEATPKVGESIGGTPILVRDGARWFANEPSAFVRAENPRTIVGWTRNGDVMLVTIDGRQPDSSVGMSLAEAADLMLALGASDAINLDGGGSTTFVVRGVVSNQPSDRIVKRNGRTVTVRNTAPGEAILAYVERPVADALAIVPIAGVDTVQDPFAGGAVELPHALRSPSPHAGVAPLGAGLPLATAGGSVGADTTGLLLALCVLVALAIRRTASRARA